MNRYAVIDFETTGLSPKWGDRAIEIAAVIVENNRIVNSYQSLINPGVRASRFITDLTGITNEMIRKAPPPEKVMPEVNKFVQNTVLVAHNASFDRKFWEHELSRLGVNDKHNFLCTMLISRRLYPWASNHKLKTLVDIHNISVVGRHHRAGADAMMTAELWLKIQNDINNLYSDRDITFEFLINYQRMKKASAKSAQKINWQKGSKKRADLEIIKRRHEQLLKATPNNANKNIVSSVIVPQNYPSIVGKISFRCPCCNTTSDVEDSHVVMCPSCRRPVFTR